MSASIYFKLMKNTLFYHYNDKSSHFIIIILSYKIYSSYLSLYLVSPFKGNIIEPFHLENAPNLIHEFLYDIFNKKIYQNFLVKYVTQKRMCQLWCIFQTKWLVCFTSKLSHSETKVLMLTIVIHDTVSVCIYAYIYIFIIKTMCVS